eukprot:8875921-Pyramimonas_sp.AAC.1
MSSAASVASSASGGVRNPYGDEFVPKYVEIKGFILDWDDPEASAMYGRVVTDYLLQLQQQLPEGMVAMIDTEKTNEEIAKRTF